eukprot:TRINITY_DN44387_c0_g1_i4.p2 TRINITY_DN44387_c0_g1~~TRINITY_DN44387_c0_g1_i4.p2  ORF type:complete len:134 (+),score=24.52 TRINITY_DN44387_c0_g1_i4:1-402(+)
MRRGYGSIDLVADWLKSFDGSSEQCFVTVFFFFFQAEDGIRDVERSRGLGDVYKRQEDVNNDWWMPSTIDNGSLKSKLLRVGCRPLKRKYLECTKASMTLEQYEKCFTYSQELDLCLKMLQSVIVDKNRNNLL